MILLQVDWNGLFALETPLPELFVIGTVLYVGILILMRWMPRRTGAEISLMDMIWVLLITEAASHSMGDYTSLTDGIILIIIYMGWDYLINILKQRVPGFDRILSSPPLQVIRNGEMIPRNMRKEYLSKDELLSNLREHGIDDIKKVKRAFVEAEGKITAITYDDKQFKEAPATKK